MERNTTTRRCPKCKRGYLDTRTSRAIWVKLLLFWMPISRYKCDNCRKKTHVYRKAVAGAAPKASHLKVVTTES